MRVKTLANKLGVQLNELELEAIRKDLGSADTLTCCTAIRTAIKFIPDSVPLLADLYSVHLSNSSVVCASDSLAAIRRFRSHAVPFLVHLSESRSSKDRRNAIHLLLGLGHNRARYRIQEPFLDDRPDDQPDWGTQRDLVVERLNLLLHDPDPDVRVVAAASLDDIHETPDEIVTLLIEGLSSQDPSIQKTAALHLGRLRTYATPALPTLIEFVKNMKDPSDGILRPTLAARKAIQLIES